MALYKVKGIYYFDIGPRRPGSRGSTGTNDRKAAQEYHDKLKAQLWRKERLGEDSSHTWDEAAALWLNEQPRDKTAGYRLKWITTHLQGMSLSSLTSGGMETVLTQRDSSPGTYNAYVTLILAILNRAKRKWGTSVPRLEKRKQPEGRIRWLSAQEWDRLKQYLPRYLLQMARFTLATGLRENNVLRLEWSQVDMKRKVAWIHPDQAKARKAIGVPLNSDAMRVLREQVGLSTSWVFPLEATTSDGNDSPPIRASSRKWYEALAKAGLEDFRWHDLRHTYFSWAAMAGLSLQELMKLGGWSTPAMAMRYIHLSPEHLAKAANRVKPIRRRA